MTFRNTYEDDAYAAAYAKLEFPGTYYLAFRDLPDILARHTVGTECLTRDALGPDDGAAAHEPGVGKTALDFGCGAGRSTRFLRKLGFDTIGVDISDEMIRKAKAIDPDGDYRLVADRHLGALNDEHLGGSNDQQLGELPDDSFDVVLSAFPFDNIPTIEEKIATLAALRRVMRPGGVLVNLVSSPEIYRHEWASFSTKDFPENRQAKCGDTVRIIVTALDDHRPAIDVLCPDADYRRAYDAARLEIAEVCKPLGRPDEPYAWVNETTIAPWTIYILKKA